MLSAKSRGASNSTWSPWVHGGICALLVVVVMVLDFVRPFGLSVSSFYLLPVLYLGWKVQGRVALICFLSLLLLWMVALTLRSPERALSAQGIFNRVQGVIVAVLCLYLLTERRRILLALSHSETRFRSLIENASDMVTIFDAQGRLTYLSPSVTQTLGYSAAELLRRNIFDLIHPDDIPLARRELETMFAVQREPPAMCLRLRHRDGSWRMLETISHNRLDHPAIQGVVTHSRDMTQHREADAALHASQRFNATILKTIPDCIYIHDLVEDRNVYANRQVAELLGFTSADLQAMGPDALQQVIHPEDLPRLRAHLQSLRTLPQDQSMEITYRMRSKDGTWHWMISRDTPFQRDAAGLTTQVLGTARDITEQKKLADELLVTRANLAALLENTQDAVWSVDTEMRLIVGNVVHTRLHETVFGLRPLPGQSLEQRCPPEEFRSEYMRLRCSYNQALAGNRLQEEFRFRSPSGDWSYLELSFSPIRKDGEIVGVVVDSRDVTERKRAEVELRKSEARFRGVVESGLIGILFWCVDGRVLGGNGALARLLGYSQEELHSGLLRWREMTPPEYAQLDEDKFNQVVQGEFLVPFEKEFFRKDGGRVPVLLGGGFLPGDSQNGVAWVVDLTDRKRAEIIIREQTRVATLSGAIGTALTRQAELPAMLHFVCLALVQHLGVSLARIWIYDKVRACLQLQASAGHVPSQNDNFHTVAVPGKTSLALMVQSREPVCSNEFHQQTWMSDSLWASREGFTAFAGHPLVVEERVIGVMALYGRCPLTNTSLHGLAAIADGVALAIQRKQGEEETRRAKEEAVLANQAKNEFLSRMSHELRTPLNAVLGFAQLLAMGSPTPRQRSQLEQIIKGGRHLLHLINEVLDIAKIEAGRMDLSLEPIPVLRLFQDVLELVRPLADQRGILLEVRPCALPVPHVLADGQRLKQVLLNLVSNAVKYNVERGSVVLFCEPGPANQLRLSVMDTGSGIAAEKMSRLFTPFDRLGAEMSTIEGSGLGLVLSKRLTEAMGGKIGVESDSGHGATFWIEFPHAMPQNIVLPESVAHVTEPDMQRLPESKTVLYVEDNLDNLALVEAILSTRPEISLLSAIQGTLALDLARQHAPHLILLDVHLPDISGDEVLRRLQIDEKLRQIPVVVISADATEHQVACLRAAGAKEYLSKPLDVGLFLETLDVWLGTATPETPAGKSVP